MANCKFCGTRDLTWSSSPPWKLYDESGDKHSCARAKAQNRLPKPVEMTAADVVAKMVAPRANNGTLMQQVPRNIEPAITKPTGAKLGQNADEYAAIFANLLKTEIVVEKPEAPAKPVSKPVVQESKTLGLDDVLAKLYAMANSKADPVAALAAQEALIAMFNPEKQAEIKPEIKAPRWAYVPENLLTSAR